MCADLCVGKVSHSSLTSSPLCICLSLSLLFSTDLTDLEPARLGQKDLIRFMCTKGRSSSRRATVHFSHSVYLIME